MELLQKKIQNLNNYQKNIEKYNTNKFLLSKINYEQ